MKVPFRRAYGRLHSTLVEGMRRLPVSSKAFGPPKGIISDVRSWVDNYATAHPTGECWYEKIHSAGEILHPAARTLEDFTPTLLTDQKVQYPEVFLASIPRPRLLSTTGIVIAPDDRVFEQSCCWRTYFLERDFEFNSLRRNLTPVKLSGAFITLLSRHSTSYYHWFTECLLRLAAVERLPELPILFPSGLRPWQTETLDLLGISGDRRIELSAGCYEVDQLYLPSFAGYADFQTDWTFSWADWALQWLREQFCGTRAVKRGKRIYISREGVTHRRVINEIDVVEALKREGFQVVNPMALTTAEKISVFGDAEIIVGAHGAGLVHQLFAPPGAKIVEVIDPFHLGGVFSYHMGSALDQEYWYLYAENQAWKSRTPESDYRDHRWAPFGYEGQNKIGRKGFDDLTVAVDLLMRTVKTAISS